MKILEEAPLHKGTISNSWPYPVKGSQFQEAGSVVNEYEEKYVDVLGPGAPEKLTNKNAEEGKKNPADRKTPAVIEPVVWT